jgi:hypothetical protein
MIVVKFSENLRPPKISENIYISQIFNESNIEIRLNPFKID